ncbi:MAG: hypothetical protein M3463_11355 [Verrucomicrobiota bacterium]|nr:hypothetical protein [Verrucomicrobiota bacterium]
MILPENQQVTEAILYEPALPLEFLAAACAGIALLLALLFWFERRNASRPWLLPALLVFRVLAIAGVGLALANPTAVRSARQISRKHTAIYLDTSASMQLRDPASGSGNAARWRQALGEGLAVSSTLDDALPLLGAARANLSKAAIAIEARETRKLLGSADAAARAALGKIGKLRDLPGTGARLDPLQAQLEAEVLQPLERLRQIADPASEARESFRAGLTALATRITPLREQLRSIAEGLGAPPGSTSTAAGPQRIEVARRWLAQSEDAWLRALVEQTALTRAQFAHATSPLEGAWDTVQTADSSDAAASTDLQATLNELARQAADNRLDLAMIVTDGAHNAAGQPPVIPEPLARIPLLVVPIGDYDPHRDVRLRSVDGPKSVLVGDRLTVQARVSATLCEGETTAIELLNGQQVLDTRELRFEGRRADRLVDLHWRPGLPETRELTVRVRPLAKETSFTNNERTLRVSVVDDDLNLLIVDSTPRWETRYLFNLFRRETQSKLTTLLFNPIHAYPGRELPPQPALPLSAEAWRQFKIVILGDLSPLQLTARHQALLKNYVENGGCLLVIAGSDSMPEAFAGTPLADMLPVQKEAFTVPREGFTVRFTAEGLASSVIEISGPAGGDNAALWSSIFNKVPIYDVSRWSKPKASARVLIEAAARGGTGIPGRVFFATHSYGKGNVTFLSSPSTYLLRWRSGDRYHYQFWGQLVRALAANEFGSGTPLIRLQTDKLTYRPDEPVRVQLRMQSPAGAPLKGITGQIAAYQQDKVAGRAVIQENAEVPGKYEASLHGLPPGVVQLVPEGDEIARLLSATAAAAPRMAISIDADAFSAEMLPLTEAPPFFRMVDNLPSAMVISPGAVPAALEYFQFAPTVTETTRRTPLWNQWSLLFTIIGCLTLEWAGRKLAGLI